MTNRLRLRNGRRQKQQNSQQLTLNIEIVSQQAHLEKCGERQQLVISNDDAKAT